MAETAYGTGAVLYFLVGAVAVEISALFILVPLLRRSLKRKMESRLDSPKSEPNGRLLTKASATCIQSKYLEASSIGLRTNLNDESREVRRNSRTFRESLRRY